MRKAAGYALIVLSVVTWAAIAALPFMDVSIGSAAAISTALVISGEVSFFAGVALLGKEAWDKAKSIFRKK
jgi:hypothetical protein